ncbi:MAG: diguanylate cyclase (GGDEF)-like protein [Sulfurimonas sp.]|jgi:diguanylate cyclase (GGDEF)-like protein|uniref:putative bifunctional diguanylate cyclase/phosphodiesterase n=1 Tax=Sulfurimonas sp. TaxID=2022749 RepID=UPI0039E5CAFE
MEIVLILSFSFIIVLLVIWIFKLKKTIKQHFITEDTLLYAAEHDSLTGLANGVLVVDRLNQSIKNAQRHKKKIAILYLGLDHFKVLNDSLGSDTGDELLQVLSEKLVSSIRKSDTVARLGGDEFMIILDHFEDSSFIESVVSKIMNITKEPFSIQGHTINLTYSVGVSIYPEDSQDSSSILSNASIAMRCVKENGRNDYKFYTSELTNTTLRRQKLEIALLESLENEQMQVYYQLQIDTKGNKILGMEALLRWNHPLLGVLLPKDFLPLAHSTGFILTLEEWAMQTALAQYKQWHKQSLYTGKLSLNISAKRLQDSKFLPSLANLINRDPEIKKYLCFELLEAEVMQNPKAYVKTLEKLSRFGIGLSLDSFASSNTKLASLNTMFIDTIKINPSLLNGLEKNIELLKSIISLAKHFNLNLIAVGVQTKEQLSFLQENACTQIQGNLYHKPASAFEIEKKLQDILK